MANVIDTIKNEIDTDPIVRGYAGMTDLQVLADGSALTRTRDRTTMTAGEMWENMDRTEFIALSDPNKARVDRVLGLGAEVIVGPGNNHNAVQELVDTFGAGSTTITNLATARAESISRWTELGLSKVGLGMIQEARL